MKILIINGPNLNLLGRREPEIYGSETMESCLARLSATYPVEYFQSNSEGAIIDRIHAAGYDDSYAGIILNAGAYTHTSLAIADAITAINLPVIEIHISNIWGRHEPERHKSLIAPHCRGVIAGFGLDSYRLAIEALLHLK
ncbi:MAG: 3-dehydroquinate dehydratase [Muribaculaceae bacterium]|nr:3-dehydroquinate dehydratase [Muribaculaceae bacterium]